MCDINSKFINVNLPIIWDVLSTSRREVQDNDYRKLFWVTFNIQISMYRSQSSYTIMFTLWLGGVGIFRLRCLGRSALKAMLRFRILRRAHP